MQGRRYITKRSFVEINRDAFQKILIFSLFCLFCARTSVSCRRFVIKVCWFSAGLEHSLSLPQRLFGFHCTQKRRYCASCAKPFKLTCRSFASLNLVQIWQIHSKTTYIMFTICIMNMSFSFIKQSTNYFVTFLLLASILSISSHQVTKKS